MLFRDRKENSVADDDVGRGRSGIGFNHIGYCKI